MSKIDIRLQYQKDSGLMLSTINKLVTNPTVNANVQCPDCGEEFEAEDFEIDCDLFAYIEWLEETVERLQKGVEAWGSANTIATAAQNAVKTQK